MVEIIGGFVVSFLATFLQGWFSDMRAASAQQEIGKLKTERDQAISGRDAAGRLAAEAAKVVDEDDAIDALERGQG